MSEDLPIMWFAVIVPLDPRVSTCSASAEYRNDCHHKLRKVDIEIAGKPHCVTLRCGSALYDMALQRQNEYDVALIVPVRSLCMFNDYDLRKEIAELGIGALPFKYVDQPVTATINFSGDSKSFAASTQIG